MAYMPSVDENPVETTVENNAEKDNGAAEGTQSSGGNVDFENEISKWKHMSRKNEDRANENYSQLQTALKDKDSLNKDLENARGELNKVLVENARLNARVKHPEITDDMFDKLCNVQEPDAIAEWADNFAGVLSANSSDKPDEGEKDDKQVMNPGIKNLIDGQKGVGTFTNKPNKGDAYKRTMERQLERQKKARERSQHLNK